jgi:hypothetical protein
MTPHSLTKWFGYGRCFAHRNNQNQSCEDGYSYGKNKKVLRGKYSLKPAQIPLTPFLSTNACR